MTETPDLDALYAPPSEAILKGVLDRLIWFHEDYLKVATFFCLGTGRAHGLDVSPRGGPPGFVKVLDPHHVAFADWPGNNRIESLRNLTEDDRVAMLFLFPGLEVFLRINGRGRISTDAALLDRVKEGDRTPKAATVVTVEEVLFHCGRATNRAQLWSESAHVDRASVPSMGQVVAAMADLDEAAVQDIDARYDHAMRNDLY